MSKWCLTLATLAICTVACSKGSGSGSTTGPSPATPTYDIVGLGIPQFVGQHYIPLATLAYVSRFRSSVGHSYNFGGSIPGEPCRSLKHYFMSRDPATGRISFITIPVSAPVDGTIVSMTPEDNGVGLQVTIKPTLQPAFGIILFHVNTTGSLTVGTHVSAGQMLGTIVETDVAVRVETPQGPRLVSLFDVMTEALFQEYRAAGVASRADLIISKEARDADPLTCSGDTLLTLGTLPGYVALNGYRCFVPGECLGQ